ncbi:MULTISPECIES: C4-dicarboxylate TRAP transporter substrate-binding protein [Marinobacter]|uniref:C4-dicarboxylate TRAP transporter substrate-binding protein n=1 Tax=Marinobacter TaxID=2742 RepID=UPI00281274AA|nr:C4-dicarboxylate TRAP transporter substrate-binding protein [Marinobacter sp. F26243]
MIKTLISSSILTLALTTTVSAATQLRYAEGSPNRGARADAVFHMIEDVKKLSGGELTFDTHWGGALLNYKSMVGGVAGGTADMGTMLAAYDPKKLRSLTIGDIPTAYSDPWVGTRAMYELMSTNKDMQKLLADQGFVYLTGFSTTGAQFECAGDKQIRSIADIKGKRMRAVGNFAKILDDLGANLINLNISDAYQAYDTGLVDCGASYFYTIRAFKTFEVASNYTIANWGQLLGFATLMNIDIWNDLSPEHQAVLQKAGSNAVDYAAKLQIEEMELVVDGLRTGSIGKKAELYELPEEDRSALDVAAEKYVQEWIDQANQDGVDGQSIWNEFKALLAKYQEEKDSKGYPWQR